MESSTITVEELAPATANIANALVCVAAYNVCVYIMYYMGNGGLTLLFKGSSFRG